MSNEGALRKRFRNTNGALRRDLCGDLVRPHGLEVVGRHRTRILAWNETTGKTLVPERSVLEI